MIVRRNAILLVATTLIAVFVSPAFAQKVELRLLHYMDETGNRDALRKVIEKFEAANPDIKIVEFATVSGNVVPDAQAANAAHRPYDVIQVLVRAVPGARAVTNAKPFSQAADGGAFLNRIAPNLRDMGKVDGQYYLAPHSLGTPLLYYNKDLMEKAGLDPDKPPKTLQELAAMSAQVKARTGENGVYIITGGLDVGPQTMMRLAGSLYLEGNRAVFDTPEAIAAMQYWQDLVRSGLHPRVNDRDGSNIFSAGKMAFNLTTSARLSSITRAAEGRFRLGIARVPAWEGKPVKVPNSGSGMMVTAQRPEKIAAAFKFVSFLTQPDISNFWSRSTGYLPLAVDPLEEPEMRAYVEKHPAYRVLVEQMRDTVPTAFWPGDRVVEGQTVVSGMLSDLWEGKGTAAELVPKAAKEVTRILKESTN